MFARSYFTVWSETAPRALICMQWGGLPVRCLFAVPYNVWRNEYVVLRKNVITQTFLSYETIWYGRALLGTIMFWSMWLKRLSIADYSSCYCNCYFQLLLDQPCWLRILIVQLEKQFTGFGWENSWILIDNGFTRICWKKGFHWETSTELIRFDRVCCSLTVWKSCSRQFSRLQNTKYSN